VFPHRTPETRAISPAAGVLVSPDVRTVDGAGRLIAESIARVFRQGRKDRAPASSGKPRSVTGSEELDGDRLASKRIFADVTTV
jgi:hypothetical protein